MQLKVVEKEPYYTLEIAGANSAYVNAVRRYTGYRAPTMAIENVEIRKNDSALYDEIVAHRLGLIPLKTDLKSYKMAEPGDESKKGSAEYELKLSLKVKGPKIVTASDMKSQDPKVIPIQDDMPIVKLIEGQKLEFEATAILGQGSEHIKWSPGLVWHEQKVKKVTVDEKNPLYNPNHIPETAMKNGKIDAQAVLAPMVADAIAGIPGVEVTYEEDTHVLYIEPWGQLAPKEMLKAGIEQFDKNLDEFDKLAKGLK